MRRVTKKEAAEHAKEGHNGQSGRIELTLRLQSMVKKICTMTMLKSNFRTEGFEGNKRLPKFEKNSRHDKQ